MKQGSNQSLGGGFGWVTVDFMRGNNPCSPPTHTWACPRLFPDGPSAATQAHTAPVVHPLLMGQPRGVAGPAGTTRSSGRGSSRSRGSTGGGGGSSANARQQLLGLLPHERLIWDGHGAPLPEGTLMDAIEVQWGAG